MNLNNDHVQLCQKFEVSEFYRAKFTGEASNKLVFVSKDASSVFQMKLNALITLLAFDALHSMPGMPSIMKSMINLKQKNDDSKGACSFVSSFSIKCLVSGAFLHVSKRFAF